MIIANEGDKIVAWITPNKVFSIKIHGIVIKKMMGWNENDSEFHPTLLVVDLDEPVNGENQIVIFDHCVIEITSRV